MNWHGKRRKEVYTRERRQKCEPEVKRFIKLADSAAFDVSSSSSMSRRRLLRSRGDINCATSFHLLESLSTLPSLILLLHFDFKDVKRHRDRQSSREWNEILIKVVWFSLFSRSASSARVNFINTKLVLLICSQVAQISSPRIRLDKTINQVPAPPQVIQQHDANRFSSTSRNLNLRFSASKKPKPKLVKISARFAF